MATEHDVIIPRLQDWIREQRVFFVGTAPGSGGRVNISPKGHDTFAIIDDTTVAYLDLTGSGAETVAHLRDNGRITIMFCAFTGPPNIVRLQGTGEPVFPSDDRFADLVGLFPNHGGVRAVVLINVERIADSCGFAVPKMDFVEQRDTLEKWTARKTTDELADYRVQKNTRSIDGLAAIPSE